MRKCSFLLSFCSERSCAFRRIALCVAFVLCCGSGRWVSAQVQDDIPAATPPALAQPVKAGPQSEPGRTRPTAEAGANSVERGSYRTWSRALHLKHPEKYDLHRIGNRGIGTGVNFYSIEREISMGKEMAEELNAQVRFIEDAEITEYVNRIVQNIVRHSDAQVPFTVKVVNDEEINTFALPGGFLYVNSGLILAADDEAALAGIVAHEVAHVAARHATKTLTKRTIFDLASLPLVFFGGAAVTAIREAATVAVPMGFLKFGRDAEREADLLAIEYAYTAGYDPDAFVRFFEKLRPDRKGKKKLAFLGQAFETHPVTEERIKRAQLEIATMLPERNDYLVTTSEFDRIRARLSALTNTCMGMSGRPALRRNLARCTNGSEDRAAPTLSKRP